MSATARHWIFKVLTGPHQGAELRLPEGRSLVGSDDECDVLLQDVFIAPQHLSIELGDHGIKLSPLGGRVYLDGKLIKSAGKDIKPYSFVTVGGTNVMIGPSNEKWPDISLADIPEIQADEEGEKDGADSSDASEAKDDGEEGTDAEDKDAEKDESAATDSADRPKVGRALVGIAFGVLLLVIWLVMLPRIKDFVSIDVSNLEGGDDPQEEETVAGKIDQVQIFLDENELGEALEVRRIGSSDLLEVVGFVESQKDVSRLRTSLQEAFDSVYAKARSLEMVRNDATEILSDSQLPLDLDVLPAGTIEVSGVIEPENKVAWNSARSRLSQEIPGITREMVVDNVVVNTPAAIPPVAAVEEEVVEETPVMVEAPVARKAEPSEILADTVEMIGFRAGGMSWVRMKDGAVYFTGGRTPGGQVITEITPGKVVVSEAGSSRTVLRGERVTIDSE